ncbi:histidine kinase [Pseudonocardia dioxanivorans CB1190]|uniref:histidine kinase n=1 Tax=Pseudonocardia dioxanivorans (strain ATCC 55486 / DSM 44775 / JCM 13855 / CB1190) TaxID=675635 RepID=F4CXK4_PSEUX|nr:HAMP domain-containing sensor histidine kinase [Pseudonocardia dioxanivorans]AEA27587.1 histidine kinase [Pseudonocardia dioxanivorans CB1190]
MHLRQELAGPAVGERDRAVDEQWTTSVLRLLVVLAVGLALAIGPQLARGMLPAAWALVATTSCYAVAQVAAARRGRVLLPPWLVTVVDGALVVVGCAWTGGAESVLVAALPLVAIAAALRGGAVAGRLGALALGAGFTAAAVLGSDATVPLGHRLLAGAWWSGFLVTFAVLVGVLVRMFERQVRTAEEERALRARLVATQRARIDGVRVVLHEFRTPVASLSALAGDLAAGRLDGPARDRAVALLADHATHLGDMLDGLADLAVADGSPLGRVRERTVVLAELADAVLDAAGVAPARRLATVEPPGAAVRADPQRLRRLLTNLVENAARHGGDAPVELALAWSDGLLTAEVRDRGPGLPAGQEGLVTAKGVALGERRGTAGLGLWIVEALVAAMDGELALVPRDGGGLVARLALPLPPA